MTQLNQVYRCNVCGNIVEVAHTGAGQLVCCGAPMELLNEKNQEEGAEKHLPVVEPTSNGFVVKIGSIAHPMEPNHYIEWIEIMFALSAVASAKAEYTVGRKYLKPGDMPEAEFEFKNPPEEITARAYCNVHGLWKS